MSFWDVVWFIVISFAFVAYLMVMFSVIIDLFRDHTTSGIEKAAWIFFLIFFPFFTALIYLIVKGKGMSERTLRQHQAVKEQQDSYIRSVASPDPSEQIAKAKGLLDAGSITVEEYNALKAKAIGNV